MIWKERDPDSRHDLVTSFLFLWKSFNLYGLNGFYGFILSLVQIKEIGLEVSKIPFYLRYSVMFHIDIHLYQPTFFFNLI